MKNIAFLLIVGFTSFLVPSQLKAQLFNGSFDTGDFSNWQLLGNPVVLTSGGPTPPSGTTQAAIQSTDAGINPGDAVSVAAIDAALGVTLPPTQGSASGIAYGTFNPTDGEAIYQAFALSEASTLTFSFAMSTEDWHPFDSAGYVLDGVYTQLVSPPVYNGTLPQTLPYSTLTLNVGAGSHTLGFVSYNTNDQYGSTTLYVTNVSALAAPEPSTWVLIVMGLISIYMFRKYRRLC